MKKPTTYQAMQVTRESAADVALWVGGTVTETTPGRKCVVVPGLHPTVNKAFVERFDEDGDMTAGDWILRSDRHVYHVTSDSEFRKTYVVVPRQEPANAP
jgi:hypothetical protein